MKMTEKNYPKLRFKGFSEPWEQRRLFEIATFSKGKGYSKSDLTESGNEVILYGNMYTKYEVVINDVDAFVNSSRDNVLSEQGDVIVPSSGETAEDISRASVVGKPGIIIGSDLNVIKPYDEVNSLFLALTISNGKQQKELIKRAQGKSIVHLHNSDLEKVILNYPSLEEQTKIGNFFKKLDDLIVANQLRVDKLIALRKAYSQRIFGQKLRFKGYSQQWENHHISEIADVQGGGTPNSKNPSYWDGEINWFTPTEVGNENYLSISKRRITELGLSRSSAKLMPPGTILMTSRAGIGSMGILTQPAATNQGFQSLVPKNTDSYFLFSMQPIISKLANKLASGSTFTEVSGKQVLKIKLVIPEINEQVKIGDFFKALDALIKNQQAKISKLKELKKAYLHQLFI